LAVKDWGLIHKRLMTQDEFKALAESLIEDK
jgi:hypothetical protein